MIRKEIDFGVVVRGAEADQPSSRVYRSPSVIQLDAINAVLLAMYVLLILVPLELANVCMKLAFRSDTERESVNQAIRIFNAKSKRGIEYILSSKIGVYLAARLSNRGRPPSPKLAKSREKLSLIEAANNLPIVTLSPSSSSAAAAAGGGGGGGSNGSGSAGVQQVDSEVIRAIALLLTDKRISRFKLGSYLGQSDPIATAVRKAFIDQMELSGIEFDIALRYDFPSFHLLIHHSLTALLAWADDICRTLSFQQKRRR